MDERFKGFARRIEAMIPQGQDEETIYNFSFGAVHALARAETLGYPFTEEDERKSQQRVAEVKVIAKNIVERGCLTTEGKWLAGFYFNDAIMRFDVCRDHLVRFWSGSKSLSAVKEKGLKALMTPWWELVKREAGGLKHQDYKEGPRLRYERAMTIVPQMLTTIEWIFDNRSLRKGNYTLIDP